ncbi:hypothetical protein O6H91_16G079400 [Diphasiastrum complanatum]|uniref:Uncharacterized protein n=1 Tax=Diphasiastrum complanatum TaxID=34168 RepID=A0ACC2BE26_DIPCM|nr:hypothetical protein O6H91_16G079400 [Diphasiastrum complanatum]
MAVAKEGMEIITAAEKIKDFKVSDSPDEALNTKIIDGPTSSIVSFKGHHKNLVVPSVQEAVFDADYRNATSDVLKHSFHNLQVTPRKASSTLSSISSSPSPSIYFYSMDCQSPEYYKPNLATSTIVSDKREEQDVSNPAAEMLFLRERCLYNFPAPSSSQPSHLAPPHLNLEDTDPSTPFAIMERGFLDITPGHCDDGPETSARQLFGQANVSVDNLSPASGNEFKKCKMDEDYHLKTPQKRYVPLLTPMAPKRERTESVRLQTGLSRARIRRRLDFDGM